MGINQSGPMSDGVIKAAKELRPVLDGLCARNGCKTMGEFIMVPITMITGEIVNMTQESRKLVEENKALINSTANEILELLLSKNNRGIVDLLACLTALSSVVKTLAR
ncbi:MAG: hypothetical protein K6U74_16935 [Firmicutes bacterium]|nr:hypothetical protein [Bacillota bacterium]